MSDRNEGTTSTTLNDQVSFDFISSDDLRKSLDSDYAELMKAITASMWKSACILAGSIAEAILMDYIAVVGNCNAEVENLAVPNIGLQKLIDAAIGVDVVAGEQSPDAGWEFAQLADKGAAARKSGTSRSLRTVYAMSSAVADFRNLIHPGRELRLKEHVDENLASAARAFTLLLCSDLSKESAARYPYRAEDVIKKAEKDVGARTVLETMLGKTKPSEVTRLLTEVGPRAFLGNFHAPENLGEEMFPNQDSIDDEDVDKYNSLCRVAKIDQAADAQTYRLAFARGSRVQKGMAMHAIAELLKTENSPAVVAIEAELLQVSGLECASDEDRNLIVGDIVDRICSKSAGKELLDSATGIGQWLSPERGAEFVEALLDKRFWSKLDSGIRRSALGLLVHEYGIMPAATQAIVHRTTNTYRDVMTTQTGDLPEDVQVVSDLIVHWDNLPSLRDFDEFPDSPSN
jgi:hypothetical protein